MVIISRAACPQRGGRMGQSPRPRHGLEERRRVCLCQWGEICVFTTTHGLEESSALSSQGNLRWKGIHEKFFYPF